MKKWLSRKRLFCVSVLPVLFLAMAGTWFRTEIRGELQRYEKQAALDDCFLGGQAPDIAGTTQTGAFWSLSAFRGKIVVVDFTADGCPYCGPAHEALDSIRKEFPQEDLVFVSVSVDETPERRDRGARRRNIQWPVIWDESDGIREHPIAGRYQIFEIPSIWIIGRNGEVLQANVPRFYYPLKYRIWSAV